MYPYPSFESTNAPPEEAAQRVWHSLKQGLVAAFGSGSIHRSLHPITYLSNTSHFLRTRAKYAAMSGCNYIV